MSSIEYQGGACNLEDLPPILQSRFEGYVVNILSDEEFQENLPLLSKKKYHTLTEYNNQEGKEVVIGFSVMVNEYSEPPEITRITKICSF